MIDLGLCGKIAALFRFRFDPALLSALAERPRRFRDLSRTIETITHGRIDDNTLTRSLTRLRRQHDIAASTTHTGRRQIMTYTITDTGRTRLRIYESFINAYTALDPAGNLLDITPTQTVWEGSPL